MKITTLYQTLLCLCVGIAFQPIFADSYDYAPEKIFMDCIKDSTYVCPEDAVYTTIQEFTQAGGRVNVSPVDTFFSSMPVMDGSRYKVEYSIVFNNRRDTNVCVHFFDVTGSRQATFTGVRDTIIYTDAATCTSSTVLPVPTVVDGCGKSLTVTGAYPSPFRLGDNMVTFAVAGVDTTTFKVTVVDTIKPQITCPRDTTVYCSVFPAYATVAEFTLGGGVATDNCLMMNSTDSIGVQDSIIQGSCPTIIKRTYTIYDMAGNSDTCSHRITIDDVKPSHNPATCMSTIAVALDAGACDTLIQFPPPAFIDSCDFRIYNTYTNDTTTSARFGADTTLIHWIAVDSGGGRDTCSFYVQVGGTQNRVTFPAITITGVQDLPNYPSLDSFRNAGGDIYAACRFDPTTFESRSYFNALQSCQWEAVIEVSLTDSSGVKKTTYHRDTIMDTQPPVFDNPGRNASLKQDDATCQLVGLTPPTATDNFGIDSLRIIDTIKRRDTVFYTWQAWDKCGLTARVTDTFKIQESVIPIITIPDTLVQCIDQVAGARINPTMLLGYPGVNVVECNLDTSSITYVRQDTVSASLVQDVYSFRDFSGNKGTAERNIMVMDTFAPQWMTTTRLRDTLVDCGSPLDTSRLGTYTQSDFVLNCNGTDTVTIGYTDVYRQRGTCSDTLDRIWVISDKSTTLDASKVLRDTQMIVIADTIAPRFLGVPPANAIADIACGAPLPAMQVLSAQDSCSANVLITMDTIGVRPTCSNTGTMVYRWIATDACNNSDTLDRSFDILQDTIRPVFDPTTPDTVTYPNTTGLCGVHVSELTAPKANRGCDGQPIIRIINHADSIITTGDTLIRWESTNPCNTALKDTIEQRIIVEDKQKPEVGLPQRIVVSLTNSPNDTTYLQPDTSLFSKLSDNCTFAANLKFGIRRMGDPTFSKWLALSDAELTAGNLTVELQVCDESGNCTVVMVNMMFQDKLPPSMVRLLPDLTISCTVNFSLDSLSIFGSYQSKASDVKPITFIEKDTVRNAGLDGLISDASPVTVDYTYDDSKLDGCGTGVLIRKFTFTDAFRNVSTAEQKITINKDSLFNPATDVQWPSMYVHKGCLTNIPSPSVAGRPIFRNNSCSMLSVPKYEDAVVVHPGGGCDKIIRTWSFIDMCVFDGKGAGRYTYEQLIKIEDAESPEFVNPTPVVEVQSYQADCETEVRTAVQGRDNCTASVDLKYRYVIDQYSNGSAYISGSSNSFSHVLPVGDHKVTWTVVDYCGNDTSFVQTVKVVDKIAPTITCLSRLNVELVRHIIKSPNTGKDSVIGRADVKAEDMVVRSVDNCGKTDEIRYSFSRDSSDNVRSFTCQEIGLYPVDIYATDIYGNQDYCKATINVQDNNGYCPANTNLVLGGTVATETNVPILETMVTLVSNKEPREYMTNSDGGYVFSNVLNEDQYTVTASRNKGAKQGVNVRDLLAIQRHLLGIEKIESPYSLLAADVDRSGKITPQDLLNIRKVILGLEDGFPNNQSWRFVSKTDGQMSELIELQNPNNSIQNADFVGIKVGDVDNSIDRILRPEGRTAREVVVFDVIPEESAGYTLLHMVPKQNMEIHALQFSVTVGRENRIVDVRSDALDIKDQDMYVENRVLKLAYSNTNESAFVAGKPCITIKIDGGSSPEVNLIDGVPAMVVGRDGVVRDISTQNVVNTQEVSLYQNVPNPFAEYTDVSFHLENEEYVQFAIYDMKGSLVHKRSQIFPSGYNTIRFDGQDINTHGVFTLNMSTPTTSRQLKIVRLK